MTTGKLCDGALPPGRAGSEIHLVQLGRAARAEARADAVTDYTPVFRQSAG